jgi:hypothetical protein
MEMIYKRKYNYKELKTHYVFKIKGLALIEFTSLIAYIQSLHNIKVTKMFFANAYGIFHLQSGYSYSVVLTIIEMLENADYFEHDKGIEINNI